MAHLHSFRQLLDILFIMNHGLVSMPYISEKYTHREIIAELQAPYDCMCQSKRK